MIVRAVGTVEIKKFIERLTGLVELRSSCLQLGGISYGVLEVTSAAELRQGELDFGYFGLLTEAERGLADETRCQ
jgi:hypothetical protein